MKKFINRPENAVEEMLEGLAVLSPGLARLSGHKVMLRGNAEQTRDQQVAVISGGGSGHEPAHAGYIGEGMLSAGVVGEVFTSPDTDSVLAAIKAVAGKQGALLVVKNYTGDRLNFGLAAEMARSEGIPVEMIVVHDDVALDGTASITGARGLAGTIFNDPSGRGYFNGAYNSLDVTVKDSKKFAATNGWGFFNFGHHPLPYAESAAEASPAECAGCQSAFVAKTDMTWVQFYPMLRGK
jgi:dihydroxyacetone kinase